MILTIFTNNVSRIFLFVLPVWLVELITLAVSGVLMTQMI